MYIFLYDINIIYIYIDNYIYRKKKNFFFFLNEIKL